MTNEDVLRFKSIELSGGGGEDALIQYEAYVKKMYKYIEISFGLGSGRSFDFI